LVVFMAVMLLEEFYFLHAFPLQSQSSPFVSRISFLVCFH
jgi:hypothetical protein